MYSSLLHIHSVLRYLVLIALIAVIVMALVGIINKRPFRKLDNKLSLTLLILTHIQLLVGLLLYAVSPFVKFGSETMKDKFIRFWTVEHLTIMLIAIVFITVARISSKKMISDLAKHKRLFTFNLIALVLVLVGIFLSGRGIF